MTQPGPGPQTEPGLDAMIARQDAEVARAMAEWSAVNNPQLADILADLRAACRKAGGTIHWAQKNGLRVYDVHESVMNGTEPTEAILGALGYQRRTHYVRVK